MLQIKTISFDEKTDAKKILMTYLYYTRLKMTTFLEPQAEKWQNDNI